MFFIHNIRLLLYCGWSWCTWNWTINKFFNELVFPEFAWGLIQFHLNLNIALNKDLKRSYIFVKMQIGKKLSKKQSFTIIEHGKSLSLINLCILVSHIDANTCIGFEEHMNMHFTVCFHLLLSTNTHTIALLSSMIRNAQYDHIRSGDDT